MSEEHAVWEVCSPCNKPPAGEILNEIGEAVFCGQKELARRKFKRMPINIGRSVDVSDAIMIDDERGDCMHILPAI